MRKDSLVLMTLIFPILVSTAAGDVPDLINYQGILTDASGGGGENGTYAIEARLWDSESGGNPIWGRRYDVSVVNGGFSVMLGAPGGAVLEGETFAVNEIGYAFSGDDRYLQITLVSKDGVLLDPPRLIEPRQRVLSAPFALQAGNGVPVGGIVPWVPPQEASTPEEVEAQVPDGFMVCDGPEAEDIEETPFDEMRIPDMTGKFLRGGATALDGLGQSDYDTTGGRKSGTNLNFHKHQLPIIIHGCCAYLIPNTGGSGSMPFGTGSDASWNGYNMSAEHGGSGPYALSDNSYSSDLNAHNHGQVMPAYFQVVYIIRVK